MSDLGLPAWWSNRMPALRELLPAGPPVVAHERRWMTAPAYALVAHTAVVAFEGPRKPLFDALKRSWKALGATSLAGDAVHRAASGEAWDMKVFEEGGTHLRVLVYFPCPAEESARGCREAARELPAYPAILAALEVDALQPLIFYSAVADGGVRRAGMLLPEAMGRAQIEALLRSEGCEREGDDLWRGPGGKDELKLWMNGLEQLNVSMNLPREPF